MDLWCAKGKNKTPTYRTARFCGYHPAHCPVLFYSSPGSGAVLSSSGPVLLSCTSPPWALRVQADLARDSVWVGYILNCPTPPTPVQVGGIQAQSCKFYSLQSTSLCFSVGGDPGTCQAWPRRDSRGEKSFSGDTLTLTQQPSPNLPSGRLREASRPVCAQGLSRGRSLSRF